METIFYAVIGIVGSFFIIYLAVRMAISDTLLKDKKVPKE